MSSQPEYKFKIGRITATIWNNDGFRTVEITRTYRHKDDAYASSSSFAQADLLNVAKCAERAEAWIAREEAK